MSLSKSLEKTAKKDIKLAGMVINRGLEVNDIPAVEVGLLALVEGLGTLKSLEKQKKTPENLIKKGG